MQVQPNSVGWPAASVHQGPNSSVSLSPRVLTLAWSLFNRLSASSVARRSFSRSDLPSRSAHDKSVV